MRKIPEIGAAAYPVLRVTTMLSKQNPIRFGEILEDVCSRLILIQMLDFTE